MPSPTLNWLKQLGTVEDDIAYGIATDTSGNVFICGFTSGELEEGQRKGRYDAYVAKYDPKGTQVWVRQFGTSEDDIAYGIATDPSGNVFVSGITVGELEPGQAHVSGSSTDSDAFLAKYDPDGKQLWLKQIGTTEDDYASAIATDASGNIFFCGYTYGELAPGQAQGGIDAYLAKYDSNGTQLWLKQLGTADSDRAKGIATDASGNVFICGTTEGDLEPGQHKGVRDAFLSKYDPNGDQIWIKQLGTTLDDYASAIATDSLGYVFICGTTHGELEPGQHQGGLDAYLAKYDPNGVKLWLKQLGTADSDYANGIATDSDGNAFICGFTTGDLEPGQDKGGEDAFLAKYDPGGIQVWIKQLGTEGSDKANAIATDAEGSVFISGTTSGALKPGEGRGGADAYLAKYIEEV